LLFNCGVILYKNTDKVRDFFSHWLENYAKYSDIERKDEPSFYYTTQHEQIILKDLPDIYNYRLPPETRGNKDIRIIHGRF
jgi:hypothetical protein